MAYVLRAAKGLGFGGERGPHSRHGWTLSVGGRLQAELDLGTKEPRRATGAAGGEEHSADKRAYRKSIGCLLNLVSPAMVWHYTKHLNDTVELKRFLQIEM